MVWVSILDFVFPNWKNLSKERKREKGWGWWWWEWEWGWGWGLVKKITAAKGLNKCSVKYIKKK